MKTLILSAVLALAASGARAAVCEGRLLAAVEPDGTVSAGDRAAVVAAARDGSALRVGWQIGPSDGPHLIHWQDARFITVFQGQVFTQLGDIHHQFAVAKTGAVELGKEAAFWNASLGTDGRLVGRLTTEAEPKAMAVRSWWCRAA